VPLQFLGREFFPKNHCLSNDSAESPTEFALQRPKNRSGIPPARIFTHTYHWTPTTGAVPLREYMYQDQTSGLAYVAVLIAAFVAVVIASIWFHPRVFGGVWMRLSGTTPEMAEKGKRHMLRNTFLGFLASIIVAYVLLWAGAAENIYDWAGALQLAFWCWIGFAAPILLGSVIWEQRPFRLYLVNAFYWLVALIAMALILLW